MGLRPTDVEVVRHEARKKLCPAAYKAHTKANDVLNRMTLASRTVGKKRDSINSYKLADQQAANDAQSKLHGLARAQKSIAARGSDALPPRVADP